MGLFSKNKMKSLLKYEGHDHDFEVKDDGTFYLYIDDVEYDFDKHVTYSLEATLEDGIKVHVVISYRTVSLFIDDEQVLQEVRV